MLIIRNQADCRGRTETQRIVGVWNCRKKIADDPSIRLWWRLAAILGCTAEEAKERVSYSEFLEFCAATIADRSEDQHFWNHLLGFQTCHIVDQNIPRTRRRPKPQDFYAFEDTRAGSKRSRKLVTEQQSHIDQMILMNFPAEMIEAEKKRIGYSKH